MLRQLMLIVFVVIVVLGTLRFGRIIISAIRALFRWAQMHPLISLGVLALVIYFLYWNSRNKGWRPRR